MTSLTDFEAKTITGKDQRLDEYLGQVVLVVNTASKCGLTPQYEGLLKLYEDYRDRGLVVIGFPCNQFMGQEPGTAEEIRDFCDTSYHVSFPITEKIDVNGAQAHPVYQELTQAADADGEAGDVKWNFEKFLVGPDGAVVERFRPQVTPDDPAVIAAIEATLPS